MAKAKDTSHARSSKTGRYVTVSKAKKAPSTSVTEHSTKRGKGVAVIGRNAETGRFVLAPAIKTDSKFRKHKSNVVREVLKETRDK